MAAGRRARTWRDAGAGVNDPCAELRAEFPVLASCVYLNSNSTGAAPRGVEDVLRRYWETLRSWRDSAWTGWLAEISGYVDALSAFLGAPAGSVVTDTNLTTLMGRFGTCLDFSGPRNRVLTTDHEFPTVPFLWRGFRRYGAEVDVVGTGGDGFAEDALVERMDERTLVVSVAHGSYRSGALVDLPRVVARAREVGALVVVDAFQTAGALPLAVQACGADVVIGGAGKWMCGAHTAFLYVRPEIVGSLRPAATGWFAGADPLAFGPVRDWAPDATRLAGGTPVPLAVMISRVGLDLLAGVGIAAIRERSLRCTDRIIVRADDAGIEVLTPREHHRRGGVVCLRFPGDRQASAALAARGIVCSWRGALRMAPHAYNTVEEIDAAMDAIAAVRGAA